jgi:hypothetical protein
MMNGFSSSNSEGGDQQMNSMDSSSCSPHTELGLTTSQLKPLNKRMCTNKEGELRSKFYGVAADPGIGYPDEELHPQSYNSTTESLPGGKLAYSPNINANILHFREKSHFKPLQQNL